MKAILAWVVLSAILLPSVGVSASAKGYDFPVLPATLSQNLGRISYVSFSDYDYFLNTQRLDGSEWTLVAKSNSRHFSWSPDYRHVAFSKLRSGSIAEGMYDVYIVEVPTGKETRVTYDGNNGGAVWSPDGKWLAYLSGDSDVNTLHIIPYSETTSDYSHLKKTNISIDNLFISDIHWFPSSDAILFLGCPTGKPQENCDIYTINPDGSKVSNLTETFSLNIANPALSPDGNKIVFTMYPNQEYAENSAEIYIFDIAKGNFSRLTDNDALDDNPLWSPDGSQVAFVSKRTGDYELFVADADGGKQQNLSRNSNRQDGYYGLSWFPDGKHLAFTSGPVAGYFQIFTIAVDGSDLSQVTDDEMDKLDPLWIP